MVQFQPGQALEILSGPFMERIVSFGRMIQGAHDLHPMIEAKGDFMGQQTTFKIDPLDVKGAA
mgnify:CR=1 FL=1